MRIRVLTAWTVLLVCVLLLK